MRLSLKTGTLKIPASFNGSSFYAAVTQETNACPRPGTEIDSFLCHLPWLGDTAAICPLQPNEFNETGFLCAPN